MQRKPENGNEVFSTLTSFLSSTTANLFSKTVTPPDTKKPDQGNIKTNTQQTVSNPINPPSIVNNKTLSPTHKLTKEEKKTKPKRKAQRDRTDYNENATASLALLQKYKDDKPNLAYYILSSLGNLAVTSVQSVIYKSDQPLHEATKQPELKVVDSDIENAKTRLKLLLSNKSVADQVIEKKSNYKDQITLLRHSDRQKVFDQLNGEVFTFLHLLAKKQQLLLEEKNILNVHIGEKKLAKKPYDTYANKRKEVFSQLDGIVNQEIELLETVIQAFLDDKKCLDKIATDLKEAKSSPDEDLEQRRQCIVDNIDDLLLKKVELIPDAIKEHAARRADLFFYLMIAVYKKNVIINKGETNKQHGKGSDARGTHACHSSLFPNLNIDEEVVTVKKNDAPVSTSNWLPSFFSSTPTLPNSTSGLEPNKEYTPSEILAKTYLPDVLNMTMELPSVVNDFDGHLEGRFHFTIDVNECIKILNQVSCGKVDPIEGMTAFYKTMDSFFNHIKREYVIRPQYFNNTKVPYLKAFNKVAEYQREGTFRECGQDFTVSEEYVYAKLMLHNITRMESIKLRMMPSLMQEYCLKMQKDILESKPAVTKVSAKK